MIKARGSNQYKLKPRYKFYSSVFILVLFCIAVALPGYYFKHKDIKIISPLPVSWNYSIPAVRAAEAPTPIIIQVAYEDQIGHPIVDEISRVFKNEGTATVVKAINCFYGESGLRTNALNINKDGSKDRGVAQINNKYHPDVSDKDAYDYKKAIAKAYKLYLSRNRKFTAWYASACR